MVVSRPRPWPGERGRLRFAVLFISHRKLGKNALNLAYNFVNIVAKEIVAGCWLEAYLFRINIAIGQYTP